MRIAIVGAGRVGGNIARQLASAGHQVRVSFARDTEALQRFAAEIGASIASPAEAVAGAEVVVISVPWGALSEALEQAGSLEGKIMIDTTNQFGPGPHPAAAQTAAAFNASRMHGARYTKSFNTLTSAFQAQAAHREGEGRVVQWLCGDDPEAIEIAAGLIDDAGYVAVELGGTAGCSVMEAPRRDGAVYGEEWRMPAALGVVKAVAEGRAIPATPSYEELPA